MISLEREDKNIIHVPSTLRSPHPYVAQTKKAFEDFKPSIFSRDNDFLSAGREEHLDVRISKGSLSRALRIMNALIKALEARGFTVSIVNKNEYSHYPSYKTCVSVLGQTIEFGLREFLKQTKRELPPAERDRWRRFEYSYSHSGRLTLEIKTWGAPRKNWSDAKIQKLEDCLNDFIIVLIKTAVELRTREIEREEEERRRHERERRREELARIRREEEARLQDLLDKVSGWQKSKQIREYIKAVREDAIRRDGGIDPGSELDKWLAWANQQADRFDPLSESAQSILDEEEEYDSLY